MTLLTFFLLCLAIFLSLAQTAPVMDEGLTPIV